VGIVLCSGFRETAKAEGILASMEARREVAEAIDYSLFFRYQDMIVLEEKMGCQPD
jgi:hypothetical protein